MDATEYLGRVRILEERVREKQAQRNEIRSMIKDIQSTPFDGCADDSQSKSRITDAVTRLEKVEENCAEAIAEYCEEKSRIIETIHRINDSNLETILFKHYVELKSFEEIALETDSSYNQIKRLRPAAVKAFERVLMAS